MADQTQPPGINFKKIVENVISYLVTGVFVGACVIVWRGATTVDERVHKTEQSFQALIDNLSAKLTSYELQLQAQSAQLESQSNQLAIVYSEIKEMKPVATAASAALRRSTNGFGVYRRVETDERAQRAMIQQDISQQLQMKK